MWTEKELLHEMLKYFETQNFFYVENMAWVMIDPDIKKGITKL